MKIIIFFILFTVQAQYIEDNFIENEDPSIKNEFFNQMKYSTIIPEMISSGGIYDNQTWPFSSINEFDLTTSADQIKINEEEQWFNVNQSNRRDPYKSILFWKRKDGATYTLTSEPRCIRQMCTVKLKYNGTLSGRTSGCLSFTLRTRGYPVGKLWIVENQELENTSQKIQLINKTLRIEHSLRSKIKNLSIETQILFRNPKIDTLILSNLNLNWKGPCPKRRLVPTPSPDSFARRQTLEDFTITTNEDFESSQDHLIYDSTTIKSKKETNTKRPFYFLNQKNFGWSFALIVLFCFTMLLSAVGHSLWIIRQHYHFTWHVPYSTQIQFLARRSIRSSTRSENKIATISEIAYAIQKNDLQKEQSDISTTNSDRSTPMSYYTYL